MNTLKQFGATLRYILAFGLMTIVFGSSFYLAWDSRPADAGLMAALFILLIIVFNFPGIESFKAFGLEVKRVQETLKEAQATVEQLKKLALSSATNQFYQLSSAGRWGGGDLEPKEKLARDLNKFLAELEIEVKDIEAAREPYIGMIRTDFFNVMRDLVTKSYIEAVKPITEQRNEIRPRYVDGKNMYDEDCKPFKDAADDMGRVQAYLTHGIPTEAHFLDVMQAQIFKEKLGERYSNLIWNVGAHMTRLYEDAKKEGHLTDEGVSFLLRYGQYGLAADKGDLRQSKYAAAVVPMEVRK